MFARFLTGLTLAVFFCFAQIGAVYAQNPVYMPSVIVVDKKRVVEESSAGKELIAAIEAEQAGLKAWGEERFAELAAAEKAFQEQQASMGEQDRNKTFTELRARRNQINAEILNVRKRIDGVRLNGQAQILQRLDEVALQVAAEIQANMVIDKRSVLVMAPDFDKTDRAITLLNEVMPKLQQAEGQ